MPHISVKMLEGRTQAQKERLAKALVKTVTQELNCSETYVTVSVEDFDGAAWQDVFRQEVTEKPDAVLVKPKYDPKSLL